MLAKRVNLITSLLIILLAASIITILLLHNDRLSTSVYIQSLELELALIRSNFSDHPPKFDFIFKEDENKITLTADISKNPLMFEFIESFEIIINDNLISNAQNQFFDQSFSFEVYEASETEVKINAVLELSFDNPSDFFKAANLISDSGHPVYLRVNYHNNIGSHVYTIWA